MIFSLRASIPRTPAVASAGVAKRWISSIAASLAPPCSGPRSVPMPAVIAEWMSDKVAVQTRTANVEALQKTALSSGLNFRYRPDGDVNIALDETTDLEDLRAIVAAFGGSFERSEADPASAVDHADYQADYPSHLTRTTPFLTQPVFSAHHSETDMMRYLRRLERKDIAAAEIDADIRFAIYLRSSP